VFSWKLTLGILAFVPFIGVAGLLQMKLMQGYSQDGREALEGAGKVSHYNHYNLVECSIKQFINVYCLISVREWLSGLCFMVLIFLCPGCY